MTARPLVPYHLSRLSDRRHILIMIGDVEDDDGYTTELRQLVVERENHPAFGWTDVNASMHDMCYTHTDLIEMVLLEDESISA